MTIRKFYPLDNYTRADGKELVIKAGEEYLFSSANYGKFMLCDTVEKMAAFLHDFVMIDLGEQKLNELSVLDAHPIKYVSERQEELNQTFTQWH